jgi:hypothetical protein
LLIVISFTFFFIRSPVPPEGPPAKVIPKGFDELGRPLDDDQSREVILMDDDAAEGEERIVPSGFDAEGHPLEEPLMTAAAAVGLTVSEEAARRLAASAAAMGIMAPAKRSKGQFL